MVKRKITKGIKKVIVKGMGHSEEYQERKVHTSCFNACRNAHIDNLECRSIADKVSKSVTKFVKQASGKGILSSSDIFKSIIKELRKYDKDAAFLYETHRDIS